MLRESISKNQTQIQFNPNLCQTHQNITNTDGQVKSYHINLLKLLNHESDLAWLTT